MISKKFKFFALTMALTITAGMFAGCGNTSSGETNKTTEQVSGTILADGSTALLPLAQEIAKEFTAKNPDATINVQGGGSGTGLNDVSAGNAQIGNSDVFAEEKLPQNKASELVDHKVCVVGFAAVVNSKVQVDSLTKQQLIDIFTGKITNWKQVGGNDLKIVILSRPKSSGTRATFKKYALDNNEEAEGQALQQDTSGAVAQNVKSIDGAISYLASSYTFNKANLEGIKVLKYESVEMTSANIENGTYPVWSYEHMYTKGKATGLTDVFIKYISGSDAKATIKNLGYIPISDMKVKR